jgi:hypothetical protein
MPAEQTITELDAGTLAELDQQRAWVAERADGGSGVRAAAADAAVRLQQVDTVIAAGVDPGATWELEALGVVLGDALAERLGVPWVLVEDEYGRDPALLAGPGPVLVFPRTMISKRIGRGESVRAIELFLTVCRGVAQHV